ncbi:MAG: PAS domain-containing protein [Nitrospirae bacterium]|nr:PAS domain-containing protein [Nitrospirota bacterium]
MNKYRPLIFSFLVFITAASAGFLCIKHCIGGHTAEERQALTEIIAVSCGFTGLIALALSVLTHFSLIKCEKLKAHAKELSEANRKLEEEIIQRKAAEERSANLAQEWARTFDSIPDLISIHSNDFRIIRANQALADFLGLKKEEITGRFCYEVFHGAEGPIAGCPNVRTMETKKPVTVELCNLKTVCHSMVSTSPIFNKQHELIGAVHIVKDTSELKKLEGQLRHAQKMEAVGQLAGGVAHDFNNVLSAITNYGYLLKDLSPGDPGHKDLTGKILSLAEKASHTTQGLLACGRKQLFELKPLNLNRTIKNIEQMLCNLIGEEIKLLVLPEEAELMIMADENHIEQCIINLAANARDAMPDGGELIIKAETAEMDAYFINSHGFGVQGAYALMTVADTGSGMDEKTRQKIFEPFFTTKEVGKGTGLGLSIIYGIVKQHKGYIDVYTRPGHGTSFKLYFPLIKKTKEVGSEK